MSWSRFNLSRQFNVVLVLSVATLIFGCAPHASGQDMTPQKVDVLTTGGLAEGVNTMRPIGAPYAANGYWEYLPPGYGGTVKSPLLVFLHGIGENGSGDASDLVIVNRNGPPKLIQAGQWPGDRPFVVLSPQHPGAGCPTPSEVRDFISFALAHYDVDASRVYLTGLSCGAEAMANYLADYGHQQVAAAVMVSGDATPAWRAQGCNIVNGAAIWSFHGDADNTVSIKGDNATLPKFMACPAPPRKDVRYTVYPGVGHDAWTQTYDLSAGHDIYTWMLGFSKTASLAASE